MNKLRQQIQERPHHQQQQQHGQTIKTDIALPDPRDQFRFYSQEDKDKLGVKNGRIGSELNKINADIYNFIKGELMSGHLVCRNTIAAYVAKSDKLSFSDEWFASFCELYNLVEIGHNGQFHLQIARLSGYEIIEKDNFHRKKFCQWQRETQEGELTRCTAQVNRPCSNAHCKKVACAERHSVTLCLKCAHVMDKIASMTHYTNSLNETQSQPSSRRCHGALVESCKKVTRRTCANADCRASICKLHSRLVCLACVTLPERDYYSSIESSSSPPPTKYLLLTTK